MAAGRPEGEFLHEEIPEGNLQEKDGKISDDQPKGDGRHIPP
jgi:hypothetical protein